MEGTISIADLKAAFGNFDAVSMNQTKILDRILGIISGEVPLQSNPKTNSLVDQIGPESKSNQDKRKADNKGNNCLLYTSPSPRDRQKPRMPSSA